MRHAQEEQMSASADPVAEQLAHLLPPATPDGTAQATREHFDALHARISGRIALIDALRGRFPRLPEPPAQQSLQDLVQAGRRALREQRAVADTTQLQASAALVKEFREGLMP
jgi:hypothetical protein